MKVYHSLDQFTPLPHATVTSGTFDGVHIGHQKILRRLREQTVAHRSESVLITYWPHPRFVLFPEQKDLKLLTTLEEKIALLRHFQVDHLLVLPFNKEFSQLSSSEFVQQILIERIGAKRLVIGYDHRFGRNREGSFQYLTEHAAELGFEVEEIPRQEIEEVGVSSTRIREALNKGEVETANKYLGHAYPLNGLVIRGNQLGRTIGFPTANLEITDSYKLIPAPGTYAVRVRTASGMVYGGMLNTGFRPTVSAGLPDRQTEVHLFDFGEDLYGQRLTVEFVAFLRAERKFEGMEALQAQLSSDRQFALSTLLEHPSSTLF